MKKFCLALDNAARPLHRLEKNCRDVIAVLVKHGDRCELAVLNPGGTKLDLDAGAAGKVSTDARAAYLDFQAGKLHRVLVVQGTSLKVGPKTLLETTERKDFETAGSPG